MDLKEAIYLACLSALIALGDDVSKLSCLSWNIPPKKHT